MKLILIAVLMSGAILLGASSCATVPTGPLAPGELRLLGGGIPRSGAAYRGTPYEVEIAFKADAKPTIRRACFSFSWEGENPSCYAVKAKGCGIRVARKLHGNTCPHPQSWHIQIGMLCRILAGQQNPTDECHKFSYRSLLI